MTSSKDGEDEMRRTMKKGELHRSLTRMVVRMINGFNSRCLHVVIMIIKITLFGLHQFDWDRKYVFEPETG